MGYQDFRKRSYDRNAHHKLVSIDVRHAEVMICAFVDIA